MNDVEKVFSSYDIQACLYDERRVDYFRQAIYETVKPGDIVVDGGSGTGILGMLAVWAGARKVYCVEIKDEYLTIIRENAARNDMSDNIIPILGDATKVDLPERVDVIVSEVLSCGFFYEPQLQIVANLKRFLKEDGAIIPATVNNYVELIDAQEQLYGLKFNYDSRWRHLDDTALTTKGKYLTTRFVEETPFSISAKTNVRALISGLTNAIRVTYDIGFSESIQANEATEFLLNRQIIFLDQPVEISQGGYYGISLAYTASSSPLSCAITIDGNET